MNYEELLNKLKEGEEYANLIRPKNIFNRNELESFQQQMTTWFNNNVGDELTNLIKQYPNKKDELTLRLMAIIGEGKILEHSLLAK